MKIHPGAPLYNFNNIMKNGFKASFELPVK